MNQLCTHFTKIKTEQLSNKIKQLTYCDAAQQSKCKNDEEKWICLECGYFGCGRSSENQCTLKHNKQSDHKLVLSVNTYQIWCYGCDDDFDTILEDSNSGPQANKMKQFQEAMKQLIYTKMKGRQDGSQIVQKQESQQFANTMPVVQPLNYTPIQVFGLKNLGNTCFFNSVMQCLNGAAALNQYYTDSKNYDFSKITHHEEVTEDENGWVTITQNTKPKKNQQRPQSGRPTLPINVLYQNFLLQARRSKGLYDPIEIFKQVGAAYGRFRSMAQQDAQELLRCLLDALTTGEEKITKARINNVKTVCKPKRTITETVFGSYLCNYLECLDCGHISRTFDFCLDYAIQIGRSKVADIRQSTAEFEEIPSEQLAHDKIPYFNNHILVQRCANRQQTKGINITLQDCLDSFTEFEELNLKKNYFKCEECQKANRKSNRAVRKFYLYDLPPIVTIVLKRFQQKSTGRFEKVPDHVEFPEELDMLNYSLLKGESKYTVEEIVQDQRDNMRYKLFGVVVHQGTMMGGHYIAYVKHSEGNHDHWYYFSDSNVKEVSLKNVLNAQAYILFYQRM